VEEEYKTGDLYSEIHEGSLYVHYDKASIASWQ
jgi:hypothetical protein